MNKIFLSTKIKNQLKTFTFFLKIKVIIEAKPKFNIKAYLNRT